MVRQSGCPRALRSLAAGVVLASLCGSLPAAGDPDKTKEEEARREEQARKVHRSAAQYVVSPAADRKASLDRANANRSVFEGAEILWVDDRPSNNRNEARDYFLACRRERLLLGRRSVARRPDPPAG